MDRSTAITSDAGVAEVGARDVAALIHLKERAHAKTDELLNLSGENGAARFTASYHAAQAAIEDTLQFYIQVLKERRDELLRDLESVYEERQAGCRLIQERSIEASRGLNSISQSMDRLMACGRESEILRFKRPLTHLMENVLMGLSDSLFGWTGDVQFVTNYQAIQSGVQHSYGFIEMKDRQSNRLSGSQPYLPSTSGEPAALAGFPFPTSTASMPVNGAPFDRVLPVADAAKRTSPPSVFPYSNSVDPMLGLYDKWMDNDHNDYSANTSLDTVIDEPLMNGKSFSGMKGSVGSRQTVRRMEMASVAEFGDFGTSNGQFSEPSGVAVNAQGDILVADTKNHRVQIFDQEGRVKFAFGEYGIRDFKMLYCPSRAAVARSGDIAVTESSPTHHIQVYNQCEAFSRIFGADILRTRSITFHFGGRVIVVYGVPTNDNQEIFISDNRAHSVKVFNPHGIFLRQIGDHGATSRPEVLADVMLVFTVQVSKCYYFETPSSLKVKILRAAVAERENLQSSSSLVLYHCSSVLEDRLEIGAYGLRANSVIFGYYRLVGGNDPLLDMPLETAHDRAIFQDALLAAAQKKIDLCGEKVNEFERDRSRHTVTMRKGIQQVEDARSKLAIAQSALALTKDAMHTAATNVTSLTKVKHLYTKLCATVVGESAIGVRMLEAAESHRNQYKEIQENAGYSLLETDANQ